LDTGKKIMFLVRKVVFQSGNPISTTCFSIPEEFVGVGSFARLPSASHEYSPPHTRRPSEEFLREALPISFRLTREGRLRLREGSHSTFRL
jgi:hypothetical protein